jgi:hypothetical protein
VIVRDYLIFGVVVVILLGPGGFRGWHMTTLALALVTLAALIVSLQFIRAIEQGDGPSESGIGARAVFLVILTGMWLGALARPISAFLRGTALRISTDLFIR